MDEVTRLINAAATDEAKVAADLLPLVYDELRKLAAARMAEERPGQTLQATALVHEAYLRLVGESHEPHWENRRHFFAAAAEAMRRILIESARRKGRDKHGAADVARRWISTRFSNPVLMRKCSRWTKR
jgi:RNA polymerase sigma factor (TIGR02999 family)